VCLPINRLVARSDGAAVFLHGAIVSRAGFVLLISFCWRDPALVLVPMGPVLGHGMDEHLPRLRVLLPGHPTPRSMLIERGLPNGLRQDFDCVVRRLPEGDTVEVVCEWPAAGIAESTLDLDAATIRHAAAS